MAEEEYLNKKNVPAVVTFIIWCFAIYISFLSFPSGFWEKLVSTFEEFRVEDGIIIALSPIIALILNGLVSPGNKARLVFWRLRNALPGHRVFSRLAISDPRIDWENLLRKMVHVPQDPKEQNTKWYSLYRRYSESVRVREAHRSFLLTRDLCSVSFLFAIFGPWGLLLFQHMGKWALLYFIVMILHYLVLALVAQNYGNRFVCNVVTEYTSDTNP